MGGSWARSTHPKLSWIPDLQKLWEITMIGFKPLKFHDNLFWDNRWLEPPSLYQKYPVKAFYSPRQKWTPDLQIPSFPSARLPVLVRVGMEGEWTFWLFLGYLLWPFFPSFLFFSSVPILLLNIKTKHKSKNKTNFPLPKEKKDL